jgi:hypothetical protein
VALECAPQFTIGQDILVIVLVTYESLGTEHAKPITFHTYPFLTLQGPREGYRMYRRRNDKWEECGDNGEMGYSIIDDPDVSVNVSTDEHFSSLLPGESWSHQQMLKGQNW